MLKSNQKVVSINVNGNDVDLTMMLGPAGEAYFVEENQNLSRSELINQATQEETFETNSPQSPKKIDLEVKKELESSNWSWSWGWGRFPVFKKKPKIVTDSVDEKSDDDCGDIITQNLEEYTEETLSNQNTEEAFSTFTDQSVSEEESFSIQQKSPLFFEMDNDEDFASSDINSPRNFLLSPQDSPRRNNNHSNSPPSSPVLFANSQQKFSSDSSPSLALSPPQQPLHSPPLLRSIHNFPVDNSTHSSSSPLPCTPPLLHSPPKKKNQTNLIEESFEDQSNFLSNQLEHPSFFDFNSLEISNCAKILNSLPNKEVSFSFIHFFNHLLFIHLLFIYLLFIHLLFIYLLFIHLLFIHLLFIYLLFIHLFIHLLFIYLLFIYLLFIYLLFIHHLL